MTQDQIATIMFRFLEDGTYDFGDRDTLGKCIEALAEESEKE